MTSLTLVRGPMLLATIAWAAGEVLMRRTSESDRLARWLWTAGIALAVFHVVLAFELVFAWDHQAAVAATVQQAVDRFGWGPRGGIYANYAFLAWWMGDVAWWWIDPASHRSRSRRFEAIRLVLFAFMFVNGAVVFASPLGRLVGVPAVAAALFASPSLRRSSSVPA